jgi:nucleotide-binding universal stress UspA family protein
MLPKIKTILYATGIGPRAPYVFRYALALARQHGATIVAVHGMEPLSDFGQSLVEQYISHEDSDEMHKKARESVRTKLAERIRQFCTRECDGATECENVVTSIKIVEGYPAQVIIDAANECAADLIVMGAQRHTMIGEVMLGSTTRKVLHTASQPVLVVKTPKDYEENLA